MNYCGFNIEPFSSDVCEDHRRPQTLAEICRNMGICCGFRTVAAREKYPGFILLWGHDSVVPLWCGQFFPHYKHPTAHPRGQDMGRRLWEQSRVISGSVEWQDMGHRLWEQSGVILDSVELYATSFVILDHVVWHYLVSVICRTLELNVCVYIEV